MDYRTLGGSGCAVSSLCLGTMTFGAETDEPGAHEQLDHYAAAGGTLIDTADVYSHGVSEAIIGRWFAQRRRAVRAPADPGPGRLAGPAARRGDRSVPGACVRPVDPAGRDAAHPG